MPVVRVSHVLVCNLTERPLHGAAVACEPSLRGYLPIAAHKYLRRAIDEAAERFLTRGSWLRRDIPPGAPPNQAGTVSGQPVVAANREAEMVLAEESDR